MSPDAQAEIDVVMDRIRPGSRADFDAMIESAIAAVRQ